MTQRRGIAIALVSPLLAAWGADLLNVPLGQLFITGPSARIMTYNVARGTLGQPAALAQTPRAADADIILLQESNFVRASDLAVIRAALPGYRAVQAHEVTSWTRLPLLDAERLNLPLITRQILVTRLRWNAQPLTVINIHLGTVMLTSALKGDLARIRRTRDVRTAQIRVVTEIAARTQGRLLLGSDLNTPPRTGIPASADLVWMPGTRRGRARSRLDFSLIEAAYRSCDGPRAESGPQ
ncbi:endonuclease/exonuclease/phosphatase family protein [Deinococcus deserti]|uniref:endonuclease/exonuclease/phosphatase family protein n=1 Tax=Deinococcus deserti TaxID=310783 RepID=UPI0013923305|nr:endonuclease/exonuclease/phosphatase family protein [Deinococcus deserti]